ncbi:MAG: hypothetical protein Q7R91_01490 [bacterium]|nr:hypothetical protein [bacterium]
MSTDTAIVVSIIAMLGITMIIIIAGLIYLRKLTKKPKSPAAPHERCEAITNFGFPLSTPTRCWRKPDHERYGVKHYAEKGDGTTFKNEW